VFECVRLRVIWIESSGLLVRLFVRCSSRFSDPISSPHDATRHQPATMHHVSQLDTRTTRITMSGYHPRPGASNRSMTITQKRYTQLPITTTRTRFHTNQYDDSRQLIHPHAHQPFIPAHGAPTHMQSVRSNQFVPASTANRARTNVRPAPTHSFNPSSYAYPTPSQFNFQPRRAIPPTMNRRAIEAHHEREYEVDSPEIDSPKDELDPDYPMQSQLTPPYGGEGRTMHHQTGAAQLQIQRDTYELTPSSRSMPPPQENRELIDLVQNPSSLIIQPWHKRKQFMGKKKPTTPEQRVLLQGEAENLYEEILHDRRIRVAKGHQLRVSVMNKA
jgi:hypothetical protein